MMPIFDFGCGHRLFHGSWLTYKDVFLGMGLRLPLSSDYCFMVQAPTLFLCRCSFTQVWSGQQAKVSKAFMIILFRFSLWLFHWTYFEVLPINIRPETKIIFCKDWLFTCLVCYSLLKESIACLAYTLNVDDIIWFCLPFSLGKYNRRL